MIEIKKAQLTELRQDIAETERYVLRELLQQTPLDWPDNADFGEFNANIMLAFRHLEDARMRLGKAIQALDGGVSIYDK